MDYSNYTVEQLDAAIMELSNRADALRAEAFAATSARDHLVAKENVRAKIEAMSDHERAALAQFVSAVGVESGEAVGTPRS